MIVFHRAAALSLAVFTLVAALIGTPAQAVPVTVGGTTYDVQFFQGPQSFNDNRTVLENTPWFGDPTLASDLADAYGTDVGTPYPFNVNAGFTDSLFFAHDETAGIVDLVYLQESGFRSASSVNETSVAIGVHYAYGSAVAAAVPEIDGNALGQAGLILLALFLVLHGRRGGVA